VRGTILALSAKKEGVSQVLPNKAARATVERMRRPSSPPAHGASRMGRAPSTSRQELEQVCLELFTQHGFEATSIEDIAAAAGIGRRTFFRYFPSKNDAVWGDFDEALDQFEAWFLRCRDEVPLMTAIRRGVVAFNTFDPTNEQSHRNRMSLILNTEALRAHSTLRHFEWRQIVVRFAARRMGSRPEDLLPRAVGRLALGASLAAYEQWLAEDGSDLLTHLEIALSVLDDSRALKEAGGHR
jgi:mycofactocin system transcriptional regulator